MRTLVREMRQGIGDHPEVESLMTTLIFQLNAVKGKEKYGYLPKDVKAIVEAGNQYAQYTLGKLYLEKHDQDQSHYWFTQSAAQGNAYTQFFLDRWDNLKSPSVMLSVSRLLHHMSRVFQEQTPAPSIPGSIQIDHNRLAQLREMRTCIHKCLSKVWI